MFRAPNQSLIKFRYRSTTTTTKSTTTTTTTTKRWSISAPKTIGWLRYIIFLAQYVV